MRLMREATEQERQGVTEYINSISQRVYTRDEVIDMLKKLKLEIDSMPKYFPYTDHTRWYIDGDISGLIQKHINELKTN